MGSLYKGVSVLCVFLLSALLSYPKTGNVYGTVTDNKGKPIEQCLIRPANSGHTTYSNLRGEFSINYDSDSSHTLILSCAGYETQEVEIGNDALWVILKRRVNELKDVIVSADYASGRIRQGTLGKRNLKPYGICTGLPGKENAIFLRADSTKNGLLQKVFFYITNDGVPSAKFAIHVYNIDTTSLPGVDMLDSNVSLHAITGDEWVSVDLSSRHIPLGKGVFISMEWISGSGNNPDIFESRKYKGELKNYNGQVLAFTKGYNKRGSLLYHRTKIYPWEYLDVQTDAGRSYINPMIYATYTYRQK